MKVISIIFILILGFIVGFNLANWIPISFNRKKIHFNNEQQKIIKGLKEKKDAQLKEINNEVEYQRTQALKEKEKLQEDYQNKIEELDSIYKDKFIKIKTDFQQKEKSLNDLQIQNSLAREAKNIELINNEQQDLNNKISELRKQYKTDSEKIKMDFLAFSEQINSKKEKIQEEIEYYENKQNQIIARLKEDELKKNERDFYKIKIDSTAKTDIQKLKNLTISFNKPDVIYKLIWEVYYKSLCESLFKRVLGNDVEKGGIYKITDITNEKVYIGRAVNFKERWRTHCKRGCGIEKIKGLLYDEMLEKGLENFTFEVVEICPKEEQAEKEKYWISFYHSDSWGYNQNKGG